MNLSCVTSYCTNVSDEFCTRWSGNECFTKIPPTEWRKLCWLWNEKNYVDYEMKKNYVDYKMKWCETFLHELMSGCGAIWVHECFNEVFPHWWNLEDILWEITFIHSHMLDYAVSYVLTRIQSVLYLGRGVEELFKL